MRTKGVASVRSPVRNLVQSSASVTHEAFVDAVIQSFREEYAVDGEVSRQLNSGSHCRHSHVFRQTCFVHETSPYLEDEYFKAGMSELQASVLIVRPKDLLTDSFVQSWDWAYGQTPEFEDVISAAFQWGELVGLHSRLVMRIY